MAQDSPVLEALALNYLTYGFQTFANNLWAWITLLITTTTAAAITFWGTTTNTTATASSPQDLPPTTTTTTAPDDDQAPSTINNNNNNNNNNNINIVDSIGRTSGKFAVYFDLVQEEDFQERDNWAAADSSIILQNQDIDQEWEAEERFMRNIMRMDFSWYAFQDLTVIDGNVVKVWEHDYAERRRRPRLVNLTAAMASVPFNCISSTSTVHLW